MTKYIDADKLRAEIEERKKVEGWCEVGKDTANVYYARGFRFACDFALTGIDSLQQEQSDNVLIPRWCLENIENTLRIYYNINNDAKDGETCQDRNIKESLNCVRKLLNGEEITGRERLEPLMEQPEESLGKTLDEAAHQYAWNKQEHHIDFDGDEYLDYGPRYDAFKAGAKWMAGQGETLEVTDDTTWGEVNDFIHRNCDGAKEIQIRKKED